MPCFLWEGNTPGQDKVMTYAQVLDEVCQLVSVDLLLEGRGQEGWRDGDERVGGTRTAGLEEEGWQPEGWPPTNGAWGRARCSTEAQGAGTRARQS